MKRMPTRPSATGSLANRTGGEYPDGDEARPVACMADVGDGMTPFARARRMFSKGDFLNAIDVLRGISDPQSEQEKTERDYLIVLALARAGATRQALQVFDATLTNCGDATPPNKARDIASLRARC